MKKPLLVAALLVLAGIAYILFRPTEVPKEGPTPTSTSPAAVSPESPAAAPQPVATTPTSTAAAPSPIDATWKTYVNAALGFKFQWPTRGRYAPTWDVKIQTESACTNGTITTLRVGDVSFCHASSEDGAAGTTHFLDTFETTSGSRYIVITFTKAAYSAGALDCPFAATTPYTSSNTSCVPFEKTAYQSQLTQIIGTFTYTNGG